MVSEPKTRGPPAIKFLHWVIHHIYPYTKLSSAGRGSVYKWTHSSLTNQFCKDE